MSTIMVPVRNRHGEHNEGKRQEVRATFGMDIATHVALQLAAEDIARMREIARVAESLEVATISDYIGKRRRMFGSFATLYRDGEELLTTQYMDLDREYNTFEKDGFSIVYDRIYEGFTASFLYVAGYGAEFVFRTKHFRIPA